MKWSPKQKKAYHRLVAGMLRHRSERCRFMTLTTSPDMCRTLDEAWVLLQKRLRNWGFKFNFIKIKTSEGEAGVIHVLFFGDFIPKQWLKDTWQEVSGGAFEVDIRQVKGTGIYDRNRLATYAIEQYTGGQEKFVSYYCSWNWIYKGAWNHYNFIRWNNIDWLSPQVSFVTKNNFQVFYQPRNIEKIREIWEETIIRGEVDDTELFELWLHRNDYRRKKIQNL